MNRKSFSMGFLMILVISLMFTMNQVTADEEFNVAVVFSTGGLGDKSFNDAAFVGLLDAYEDFVFDYHLFEPKDVNEINGALLDYADNEEVGYDLIIAIGFSSAEGVEAAATAYPDKNFVLIDSVVELDNVASIVFKEHEGSFLAGAMAGMVTKTNKLGFIGGLDIPLINRFGAGFEHGARYINSRINVDVTYSPNPENPWADIAGGKQVAESFIDDGVDIIFAAAGGTGLGVIDAVEEATTSSNKIYAIGVDSNQDHLSEGKILTSMVKRVDVAVYSQIEALVNGEWESGFQSLGIVEAGVSITEMQFTQAEANVEYESGVTRYQKILELAEMIKEGTLKVAEDFDSVDDLLREQGRTRLSYTYIGIIFAIVALPIIRKIRK
jgi:basic membrane protein A and related proteins